MSSAIEIMKSLTYGTELEYTGINRKVAAVKIQEVVGGTVQYAGTGYQQQKNQILFRNGSPKSASVNQNSVSRALS